jgi:hypothetical protein
MFGETQISAWFFHYIDMLQDVGCNELATYMAKMCDCEEVKKVIEEVKILNAHVFSLYFRICTSNFFVQIVQQQLRAV